MEIRGRHWTVAAVAAAGLHLAVAAWVFRSDSPPAASFGGGGSVEVALAPSSGAALPAFRLSRSSWRFLSS